MKRREFMKWTGSLPALTPLLKLTRGQSPDLSKIMQLTREKIPQSLVFWLQKHSPIEAIQGLFNFAVEHYPPHWYLGGEFHPLLMGRSFCELFRHSSLNEQYKAVLLAADYVKKTQQIMLSGHGNVTPFKAQTAPPLEKQKAKKELAGGMLHWDFERAERGILSLVKKGHSQQAIQALLPFAVRDFRTIGHKVVFSANTLHHLPYVSPSNAQLMLRSLARGLLITEGNDVFDETDVNQRMFLENQERVNRIVLPPDPESQNSFVMEFLDIVRLQAHSEVCDFVVDQLKRGVAEQSIWDGIFCAAAEILLANRKDVVAEHAVTSINSYHTCYRYAVSAKTKLLILLQAAARIVQFRKHISRQHGGLDDSRIMDLNQGGNTRVNLESLLGVLGENVDEALPMAFTFAGQEQQIVSFQRAAIPRILDNALDIHDFKHAMAVFEDLLYISPAFKPYCFAASLVKIKCHAQGVSAEKEKQWISHPHKLDRLPELETARQKALSNV